MNVRAEVIVHGFVQGVGYRRFAQLRAMERDLVGSAGNRNDGTVFIEVEGNEVDVLAYLDDLKRGPSFSRVSKLDISWQTSTGQPKQFTIRY